MTDIGNIPVVSTGGDGMGGNLGIFGIIALLAFAGGGFGFGGRGAEATRETDYIMNTMNSRFNDQSNAAEFRFMAQANNINHISALEQLNDMDQSICATNQNILEEGHKNALIEKDTQLQIAIGNKDLAAQLAECCCASRLDTERIMNNQLVQTGAILSAMAADKEQALRDRIAALEKQIPGPSYIAYAPGQPVFPPVNAAAYNYGGFSGGCGNVAF